MGVLGLLEFELPTPQSKKIEKKSKTIYDDPMPKPRATRSSTQDSPIMPREPSNTLDPSIPVTPAGIPSGATLEASETPAPRRERETPPGLSPYGQALFKQVISRPGQPTPSPKTVMKWGLENPASVLHFLPPHFQERLEGLPPVWVERSEQELMELTTITRQDRRVRIQFWEEYERAAKNKATMEMSRVAFDTGVPSWGCYEQKLLNNDALFAWLLHPPTSYQLQMKEAHELSLERLIEILGLPLTNKKGEVNVPLASLLLHVYKLIDARVHGSITQRMVNLNLNADAGKVPENSQLSMEEVERKLRLLAQELGEKFPDIEVQSQPAGFSLAAGALQNLPESEPSRTTLDLPSLEEPGGLGNFPNTPPSPGTP